MSQSTNLGAQPNQSGAGFRTAHNDDIKAVVTQHSGAGDPPLMREHMEQVNTTLGQKRIRKADNSAWGAIVAAWDGVSNWIPYRAGKALTAASTRLDNLTAVVDPTSSDGTGLGYEAGSLWLNTATGIAFLCRSAAPGTAVWLRIGFAAPTSPDRVLQRVAAADGSYLTAPEIQLTATGLDVTDAAIPLAATVRVVIRAAVATTDNTGASLRIGVGGALKSGASDYNWVRRDETDNNGASDAVLFGDGADAEISLTASKLSNDGGRKTASGEIVIYQTGVDVKLRWDLVYWAHSGGNALRRVTGAAGCNFDGPFNRISFSGLGFASGSFNYFCRGDFA
jgi:hypothetical protein